MVGEWLAINKKLGLVIIGKWLAIYKKLGLLNDWQMISKLFSRYQVKVQTWSLFHFWLVYLNFSSH